MAWLETVKGWDVTVWVTVASALLALASFFLNWLVVRRQTAMQFESLKAQMDADVLAWGKEAMDALTEAAWIASNRGLTIPASEILHARNRASAQLSGLVDKGRLFFPNRLTKGRHSHKERAFRGGRPFVLNPLVFAFYEMERLDHRGGEPDQAACAFFIACRREFVSELQNYLDPRRRSEEMRRLGRTSQATQEESFQDSLNLALKLDERHPGLLDQKGDDGWARNVKRAKQGDRSPFQELNLRR